MALFSLSENLIPTAETLLVPRTVFSFCPTHFRPSPVCRCVSDVSLYFLEATIPRHALLVVGIGALFLWMGKPVGCWIPVGTDGVYTAKVYRLYLYFQVRVQYGCQFIPPAKEKGDRKSFIAHRGLYIKCTVLCSSPDGE